MKKIGVCLAVIGLIMLMAGSGMESEVAIEGWRLTVCVVGAIVASLGTSIFIKA